MFQLYTSVEILLQITCTLNFNPHDTHFCVENQLTIPADKSTSLLIITLLNIMLRHPGIHWGTQNYCAYFVLVCKYVTTFSRRVCFWIEEKIWRHIQSYAAFGKQIIHLYIVDMLQGLLYKDCLWSLDTSTANYWA